MLVPHDLRFDIEQICIVYVHTYIKSYLLQEPSYYLPDTTR